MHGWDQELLVVRGGSYDSGERSALIRDIDRGLLVRLRRGVYTDRAAFGALPFEQQHIVHMRAFAEVSSAPVVFSHASAAVAHGLPVLPARLARVHITVQRAADRSGDRVAGHVFRLREEETTRVGSLLVTALPRTVIDVAGDASFGEGLMVADAALHGGMPRLRLEDAAAVAGSRRSDRRIGDVVAVAHPGAESANESMTRANLIRLGFEPPELQHPLWDELGLVAYLDFWFRRFRVGGEADGRVKYLDPALARQGAGRAVYDEKLREDRVLPLVAGLARWGWREATNPVLLRARLAAFGVEPARATIADYAAAARDARPRFTPRTPLVLPAVPVAVKRRVASGTRGSK